MHGTREDANRHHPVIDVDYWQNEIVPSPDELKHGMWIDTPKRWRAMEARRRLVFEKAGHTPKGVPVDLFLWGYGFASPKKPYLTRFGGVPWREKSLPWPTSPNGSPLRFVAQLCFLDSMDIIDGPLPGDVCLIYCDEIDSMRFTIEWSSHQLREPIQSHEVPNAAGDQGFQLHAAIHRTFQYPDDEALFDERSIYDAVWQGTMIGRSVFMPQGGDAFVSAIATFSSILPSSNPWPLLNVLALPVCVFPKGHSWPIEIWNYSIGDAGAVLIGRDKAGRIIVSDEGG